MHPKPQSTDLGLDVGKYQGSGASEQLKQRRRCRVLQVLFLVGTSHFTLLWLPLCEMENEAAHGWVVLLRLSAFIFGMMLS